MRGEQGSWGCQPCGQMLGVAEQRGQLCQANAWAGWEAATWHGSFCAACALLMRAALDEEANVEDWSTLQMNVSAVRDELARLMMMPSGCPVTAQSEGG